MRPTLCLEQIGGKARAKSGQAALDACLRQLIKAFNQARLGGLLWVLGGRGFRDSERPLGFEGCKAFGLWHLISFGILTCGVSGL